MGLGLAAALAAMAWVLRAGVVYDAAYILYNDQRYAIPIDWEQLLAGRYWPAGMWRPATQFLLGVQVALGGGIVPPVFQTISLLLYLAGVAAIWQVGRLLGAGQLAVVIAVILFAIHPVHTETVASIVGQAELLCALGLLLGIATWHHASLNRVAPITLPLLFLAQVLAAGAKEQGYILPLLMLGHYVFFRPQLPFGAAVRLLAYVGLSAVSILVVRSEVTGTFAGETTIAPYLFGLPASERVTTALAVVPDVARLLLWPARLQTEYGPPELPIGGPLTGRHLLGIGLLLGLATAAWRWRRRHPLAAFGAWWIAVTWLPVSNLIVPAGILLAERVLYLPSIGLAFVMMGLLDIPLRRNAMVTIVTVTALTIAGIAASWSRAPVWRSQDSMFSALPVEASRVYLAHYRTGAYAQGVGDLPRAGRHFQAALDLWQGDLRVHEALGQSLRAQGRCAEAIPVLRSGLAIDPEWTQIRAKLGECLLAVGDAAGAEALAIEASAVGQPEFESLRHRARERLSRGDSRP